VITDLTRLVRTELTRLLWRRAVVILLALAFVMPAAVFAIRAHDTATKSIDEIIAENGPYILEEIARCERRPRQFDVPGGDDLRAACEQRIAGWYGNSPLDLRNEREDGGGLAAIVLITMLMLLLGTTFAGHDWNTGSMSNQLLFEPRRGLVWVSKALAVGLLTGAAALAALVALWTGFGALASARDIVNAPGALEAGYKQAVLGAGMATLAAIVGYALTMLLRSTVGTLGTLFAASFLFMVVVAGVLGAPHSIEPLMPWGNFYAYAVGAYEYYDYDTCARFDGRCPDDIVDRAQSIVYFLVIAAAVVVPSVLSFRRRDVP
jgi:hypothetical protein